MRKPAWLEAELQSVWNLRHLLSLRSDGFQQHRWLLDRQGRSLGPQQPCRTLLRQLRQLHQPHQHPRLLSRRLHYQRQTQT